MIIAVASDGGMVTEHFGHCEGFNVFTADGNKIESREFMENPGHRPGFLPEFLNGKGVNVVISGGMGAGAIDIFNEKGIKVITGASGDAGTAAEAYLLGELISSGHVCREHRHAHDCRCHPQG